MKKTLVFATLLAINLILPNFVFSQKSLYNKVTKATKEAYDDTRKQIDRSGKDLTQMPNKVVKEAERVYDREKTRREEDEYDTKNFIPFEDNYRVYRNNGNGTTTYIALTNIKIVYNCSNSIYTIYRKKGELFAIGNLCSIISTVYHNFN